MQMLVCREVAHSGTKKNKNEYLRFLRIMTGSLDELQTQIEISMNLYYLNREEFGKLSELCREIERMFSSLIRKLSC